MGQLVDKGDLGFGKRSWRYSMLVRDGVVEKMFVEPNKPGDPFEVSDAATMLAYVNPKARKPDQVAILTRDGCQYCAQAKALLEERGIDYVEIPLAHKVRNKALGAIAGAQTVPQVFINGERIGGYEELKRWAAQRGVNARSDHRGGTMSSKPMKIDIGISAKDREVIADGLSRSLGRQLHAVPAVAQLPLERDGPDVPDVARAVHGPLHGAVERARPDRRAHPLARACRRRAPTRSSCGSPRSRKSRARRAPTEMIRILVAGQEAVAKTARSAFTAAEAANDQPTCDLLTQRMQVHEKNAWMLRSLLEDGGKA